MKKVKKLLLILSAPAFILLISWILSLNREFNWPAIIVCTGVIICTEIILYIRKPQKLIDTVPGWMFSGALYAFLAADGMCGIYTDLLEFMAIVVFASTFFFICFPNIIGKNTRKP